MGKKKNNKGLSSKQNKQKHVPKSAIQIGQQQQTIKRQSYHEGTIPSSSELKNYEDVYPGAAEIILSMAVNQNNHQINCEKEVIKRTFNNQKRGQNYAMVSVLGGFFLSGWIAYLGFSTTAGVVASASLLGIVGVFVTNTKANNKDEKKPPN